tara:strand:+ start:3899 stop:4435 length:537 start_codon:yes stop_codon:yes gene_type:complete
MSEERVCVVTGVKLSTPEPIEKDACGPKNIKKINTDGTIEYSVPVYELGKKVTQEHLMCPHKGLDAPAQHDVGSIIFFDSSSSDSIFLTEDGLSVVIADTSSNEVTIHLPLASACAEKDFTIKMSGSNSAEIKPKRGSDDTIESTSSLFLDSDGASVTLKSDTVSNWMVIASHNFITT